MRTRKFGTTNLETSVIGFGGWPMGRGQYGSIDDAEAIAAVHAARDHGITLFDTAAVYGWGYGEKLLGRALKGWRREVVVVTKGGRRWEPGVTDRRVGPRSDSSREFIEQGIEESLRNLQTDYIDLFLIHWPDPTRPFEEPMETLLRARQAGKIRHAGVSNFSVEQMRESIKTMPLTATQTGYHIFDRRYEKTILPFAKEHGMGVMAYGTLAHGLLTGTMTKDTQFSDDDWRRNRQAFGLPLFEGKHFERNLRVVERLKKIAADNRKTLPQLAVGWVLANPAITVALCGARRPAEISENAGGDWNVPRAVMQAVEDALKAEPEPKEP
ncbi:MAG: aldo/keto reductase [Gemmatimonadetes bacterium]|nr:aldo/keto reductase [Gemmatimonadota bacterium]